MSLRHLSLFTLKPETDTATREQALHILRALGDDPNIVEWRVEVSLDQRKGYVIAENALFKSEEGFQQWRVSAKHQEAVAFLRTIADWLVADYQE